MQILLTLLTSVIISLTLYSQTALSCSSSEKYLNPNIQHDNWFKTKATAYLIENDKLIKVSFNGKTHEKVVITNVDPEAKIFSLPTQNYIVIDTPCIAGKCSKEVLIYFIEEDKIKTVHNIDFPRAISSFSSDGSKIYFALQHGTIALDIDTLETRTVFYAKDTILGKNTIDHVTWSDDNNYVLASYFNIIEHHSGQVINDDKHIIILSEERKTFKVEVNTGFIVDVSSNTRKKFEVPVYTKSHVTGGFKVTAPSLRLGDRCDLGICYDASLYKNKSYKTERNGLAIQIANHDEIMVEPNHPPKDPNKEYYIACGGTIANTPLLWLENERYLIYYGKNEVLYVYDTHTKNKRVLNELSSLFGIRDPLHRAIWIQ